MTEKTGFQKAEDELNKTLADMERELEVPPDVALDLALQNIIVAMVKHPKLGPKLTAWQLLFYSKKIEHMQHQVLGPLSERNMPTDRKGKH
jgi:hypothetical protein